ncbi:hypothetical protein QVD17_33385 [Tagetes erecta]|uniref:Pectin acetylesterase n=1 Tax=Tagetes erecta TaxID=13708 RepID=A0AAD8K0V6_TARER|nr:hypothetical protein QVD17_33385 [Tagetes erecta]
MRNQFCEWVLICAIGLFVVLVSGYDDDQFDETKFHFNTLLEASSATTPPNPLLVNLTLIPGAADTGAVCLDGTLPGYHLHQGFDLGANSWLIQLEGGGWCDTIASCVYRKTTRRGSSKFFEKQLTFTGILSNKAQDNPDFFNWNRVKVRYCDGASFAGDGENKANNLQFRGHKIFLAAMEDLMSKGMRNADQALLSGCSAGGLASILHCDEFSSLFSGSTKVKCLADAGMFMDATDVAGVHTLRNMYEGVVTLQAVANNLLPSCINQLNPPSCFFPQNIVSDIKTPMFILNAAYDSWQVVESLTTPAADPNGIWKACKRNLDNCSQSQISFFQDFRDQMLNALKGFSMSKQNGVFINSCLAHCQTERQDEWFAIDSPTINQKPIALAVGDWYFDRSSVKDIDCSYPCNKSCRN